MKALCIVAHPDDHVLWTGGAIRRLNGWTWHVLSLCNSHNDNLEFQEQKSTFGDSCKELGVVRYCAEAFHDHDQFQRRKEPDPCQVARMKLSIQKFAEEEYDLVFAHGNRRNGYDCEYGFHANHAEARDAVIQLITGGVLKTKGVLHFCYKSGGSGQPVIAELDNAHYKVDLTGNEIAQKRELKQSFHWAKGDLIALSLWENDEPRTEAFQAKDLELQLPPDFIRVS